MPYEKVSGSANLHLFGGTVVPSYVFFGKTVPPSYDLLGRIVPPNSFLSDEKSLLQLA